MLIPVVLGFAAAFLFAASAALQRSAVLEVADADVEHRASRHRVPVLWLIRRLIRKRVWLAGWATNLLGFLSQAIALHFGSIALVQPLLVTQLLFALPMASAVIRQWPALRDWLAALAIVGGVVVFLAVEGAAPLGGSPDRGRLLIAVVVAAATVVTLVQVAQGRGPLLHSAFIASAAGVCYAMSAALMKLTTDDLLNRGVLATALDWPGYLLALSTLTGLLLGQQAYGSGSLSAAIAVMSIVNPAVSYALGLLAFHATLSTSPGPLAATAGAAVLLTAGIFGLAHSPTVQRETTRTATHGVYPHTDSLPGKVATPAHPPETCSQE
ncbi:DMT family transporter [Amycolatopsis sp.]|uniref:DMT family transporter n=1 Tax=Amycolatopsis sp. TaxID=37632 RepID=UPI002CED857F|nr:DMT family transporter [Amycolatopsis sp.]HVV13354.1 DMT family transporter [Amycolatopsis sp.]